MVIVLAICTSDCRLFDVSMPSFSSFMWGWDCFVTDLLSCMRWWYLFVADPIVGSHRPYRDDVNCQCVVLHNFSDWPSLCQQDLSGWLVQVLFTQRAILQRSYFSFLGWRSCKLLRANFLRNSPFITLLHSSMYYASPFCLSSVLPSQLRNIFHFTSYSSSWLPSLYFVVNCFFIFSSVDCFCVQCLFQLHWTSTHLFHVISRSSKREGYPCKASTYSHLPK